MSNRVRLNSKRVVALRKSPRQVEILRHLADAWARRSNADFWATASDQDRHIQEHGTQSKDPYDVSVRVGSDRARAYVQTASVPARRHEASERGSSLLRGRR